MLWRESIERFLTLPRACFIILLIELLSTLHTKMADSVLYQFLLNEFDMTEFEVTALQATFAPVEKVVSILGAPLIDIFGVRRVVLVSLVLSIVKHSMLAFGRTRLQVIGYLALPAESLVSLALFSIALRDLTTHRTRPIAFALSTVLLNWGIVVALQLVEVVRHVEFRVGAQLYSGLRLCAILSVGFTVVELLLVGLFVHDVRLVQTAREPSDGDVVDDSLSAKPGAMAAGTQASAGVEAPTVTAIASAGVAVAPGSPHAGAGGPAAIERDGVDCGAEAAAAGSADRGVGQSGRSDQGDCTVVAAAKVVGRGEGYVVVAKDLTGGSRGDLDLWARLRGWRDLLHDERLWRVSLYNLCMIGARNQCVPMRSMACPGVLHAIPDVGHPSSCTPCAHPQVGTDEHADDHFSHTGFRGANACVCGRAACLPACSSPPAPLLAPPLFCPRPACLAYAACLACLSGLLVWLPGLRGLAGIAQLPTVSPPRCAGSAMPSARSTRR